MGRPPDRPRHRDFGNRRRGGRWKIRSALAAARRRRHRELPTRSTYPGFATAPDSSASMSPNQTSFADTRSSMRGSAHHARSGARKPTGRRCGPENSCSRRRDDRSPFGNTPGSRQKGTSARRRPVSQFGNACAPALDLRVGEASPARIVIYRLRIVQRCHALRQIFLRKIKRPPEGPAGADPAARGDDRGCRIERPMRGLGRLVIHSAATSR